MTLTVCIGSSGSGKTTFLNDVHKSHKCIYIRQYHSLRPYIAVSKIPNFDPTKLPYWDIYVKEGKDKTIKVGGTMAGEFTAGLSGGQRKLLLFELICQRTENQSDLTIVLDEPYSGVTEDNIQFIVERLNELRRKHNVLLVTNDHVETLTKLGDNTITVSAIDRSTVKINDREKVDREKAILALSVGDAFAYKASSTDLKFFYDVEVAGSHALMGIAAFTTFCYLLMLVTFWDSSEDNQALVLIAGGIIAFFCINPYLLALVDWRNYQNEESEALVHSSKSMNKLLKTLLTLTLVLLISLVQFGITVAVVDGLSAFKYWVAIMMDSASMTFFLICLGLYTKLPFQAVEMLGSMPFLFMIFLSTTFSPGSGVSVVKELRFLFSRFFFWCMVPSVQDDMEGCPDDEGVNLLYLILSGILGVVLFLLAQIVIKVRKSMSDQQTQSKKQSMMDQEFQELQVELFGERILRRLMHENSSRSMSTAGNSNGKKDGEA